MESNNAPFDNLVKHCGNNFWSENILMRGYRKREKGVDR